MQVEEIILVVYFNTKHKIAHVAIYGRHGSGMNREATDDRQGQIGAIKGKGKSSDYNEEDRSLFGQN